MRGILGHPELWPELVRTLASVAPDGWWRRFPFLPRPDRGYLAWRISTAYGRADARVRDEDLVEYLRWRRRQRRPGT
ncbi:MAG: hypothetical protein ACRDXD_05335 [Acidimicrobiia bacterium]